MNPPPRPDGETVLHTVVSVVCGVCIVGWAISLGVPSWVLWTVGVVASTASVWSLWRFWLVRRGEARDRAMHLMMFQPQEETPREEWPPLSEQGGKPSERRF